MNKAAPSNAMDAFARAYLETLSRGQRARLRRLILAQDSVGAEDLAALPGVQHLTLALPDGGYVFPEAMLSVLRRLLPPSDPAEQVPGKTAPHPFLAITQGAQEANRWLAHMPDALLAEDLNVGLFRTVHALKSGDLAKADALMTILSEHFEIPTLEQCGPSHQPELSCVLFMKAIYSDNEISDQATEQLFEVLARLPKDASLLRAILYNVGLDVFLRQQNMAEAEGAAHRALFHYAASGESGVAYYVHLYLALISLWHGQLLPAQERLADAQLALDKFAGAVENDTLLLRSFEMILAYERGETGAFLRHLMSDENTIPFGEIWPSIAGPIISYGRRALASNVTPAAALSWVRRWRVRQRRSQRFDALISVQEALALQDLGRWQEADEILADVAQSTDCEAMIARFASGLDRNPKSAELARQIVSQLDQPNLSVRHSLILRLLAAQSALARGAEREGARHLSAAIKAADPDALPSIWQENRSRVSAILGKRELRSELNRFPRLHRQIQTLAGVQASRKPAELTHQEYRVLQLLAEAQSNKAIGLRLGIALPTVKFHVKNLCRKTKVKNRREAVRAAMDAGWLAES